MDPVKNKEKSVSDGEFDRGRARFRDGKLCTALEERPVSSPGGRVCCRHRDGVSSLTEKAKKKTAREGRFLSGAPSGTRTRDTLIKSQVLYQLS